MSRQSVITRERAQAAVALALPLLEAALQRPEVGDGGNLHIVVVKPCDRASAVDFEEAIVYEHSIGDPGRWDADYRSFALAKARLSWRTGLDSHVVQTSQPQSLQAADTLLWGSVVLDGLVVGVSGAHPWYDEAFAGTVAMCLRALIKEFTLQTQGQQLFLP